MLGPSQATDAGDTLVIQSAELSDAGHYQCVVNATGFEPLTSPQATLTVRGACNRECYVCVLLVYIRV